VRRLDAAFFRFSAQSAAEVAGGASAVDDPFVSGSQSRKRRQVRVLLAAAALFAAVFVALALNHNAGSGLSILYLLPVVLVGVELGRPAGIAAGVVAFGLYAWWAPSAGVALAPSAYVTRALVSVLLGAVSGHLADRMRTAAAEAEASARHFELAGDLLGTATFDGFFVHLNGAWERCLGWTREELTARPFLTFVHPDDRARTEAEAARAFDGEGSARFANRYRAKDGGYRWIEWHSWIDPERQLIHAAARDVTEQRAADAQRREAEERFRRAFDDSATGMAVIGVDGTRRDVLLDANDSLGRIFGCAREQLVGTRALSAMIDPQHAPALARGMEELQRGADAVHQGEYRLVRPDGVHIWLDLTASLVRDEDGRPLYRLVQAQDVTERKTAEERLRFLADHDPLSGVFNRRRFESELQRELDLSTSRPRRSVLLLLDVDRFKAVNDTLGHAVGDAVVARLGDALRSRLRSADVVARLGGDEFAAILRRVDLPAAKEVARDLQAVATQRLATIVGDSHGPVTLSIGLVAIGEGASPDELLSLADRALYAAKAAGRNRVVLDGEVVDGAAANGGAVPCAPNESSGASAPAGAHSAAAG
jgi:diguanylate cyclase (GGDEF)-like protein/PAS domain S-box-containing protein